jgi:hypothetical protein
MRSFRPSTAALLAAALLAVSVHAQPEPEPAPTGTTRRLTLRLRDVPLNTVLRTLFQLTRQSYATGADLVGHVDVEIVDATPDAVERTLEAAGLAFSEPAALRLVALAGETPVLDRSGAGHPVSLDSGYVNSGRPGEMRDFLRLFADLTGDVFVAPSGPLGRLVLFCHECPMDDVFRASLAATGLGFRREPGRVLVFRRTDPKAVLLPLDAGGAHTGHVGYRVGEAGPATRSGINSLLVSELKLSGLARADGRWTALLAYPGGMGIMREGQPLYDGALESVNFDRVVFKKEDGTRSELVLPPAEPGIVHRPDDAPTTVARATARIESLEFEDADRILRTALAAAPEAEEAKVLRAGLADVHYRWGQVLADRYATEEAIRHFEEAYAIDATDRLWQAGEDLNEIGFHCPGLG